MPLPSRAGAEAHPLQSTASAGVLTVLDAQHDVSEVEPSLLLAEGLLTGHLHDRPVGKRDSSSVLCSMAVTPLAAGVCSPSPRPSTEGQAPKRLWVPVTQDGGVST